MTSPPRRAERNEDHVPARGAVLLIDKPLGPTSFDVVARVRRAVGNRRVGHTGTLDPLATGLLVVCLGEATKLSPFLTAESKAYVATLRLGLETESGDVDGRTLHEATPDALAALREADVLGVLRRFRGAIEQRPPPQSAVKVGGQRMYALARAGEVVEVPLRQVSVQHLEATRLALPEVELEVSCSKGTYIRSLAIDLGRALGVGGHLTALRRTCVGPLSISQAVSLERLEADPAGVMAAFALSPAAALAHFPVLHVDDQLARSVRDGKVARATGLAAGVALALDARLDLVAILEVNEAGDARVTRGFGGDLSREGHKEA